MKKLLFILCVCFCSQALAQQAVTTFILIRHAEKGDDGTKDPDLSEAGKQRAGSLVKLLKETKIDAIYSTAYKRTRNTVAPLAQSKNLSLRSYDATRMEEVDAILKEFKGGTIVLCGHSNTTPATANYLTGNKDELKAFDDGDYDNVLIVDVLERGIVSKVVWLSY